MRISKERAHDAAVKICEPLQIAIKQHQDKINADVREMVLSRVPKEVMTAYKKHPKYIHTTSSEYLGRINADSVYARFEAVPEVNFSLTSKETEAVNKLLNTKETLDEKYNHTVRQIENTILTLGTEKRVELEFPEAFPFLGTVPTTTAVALNMQPIRKIACALIPNCNKKTA